MARKKQTWDIGDIFTVQLKDSKFVLGQIIGREAKVLNSVTVAFYDLRFESEQAADKIGSLDSENLFSIVFSTRESLDSGSWHVIGNCPINVPDKVLPYEHLRNTGFIGAKVIGSGILDEFLNAYYALEPWDDWKDPQYLDQFLLTPDKKPLNLIYKKKDKWGTGQEIKN